MSWYWYFHLSPLSAKYRLRGWCYLSCCLFCLLLRYEQPQNEYPAPCAASTVTPNLSAWENSTFITAERRRRRGWNLPRKTKRGLDEPPPPRRAEPWAVKRDLQSCKFVFLTFLRSAGRVPPPSPPPPLPLPLQPSGTVLKITFAENFQVHWSVSSELLCWKREYSSVRSLQIHMFHFVGSVKARHNWTQNSCRIPVDGCFVFWVFFFWFPHNWGLWSLSRRSICTGFYLLATQGRC